MRLVRADARVSAWTCGKPFLYVSRETCITGYLHPQVTGNTGFMAETYRRPEGSEITSPLSEYLFALVVSTRGHVVALSDARTREERVPALVRALRDLERLTQLLAPDLTSSTLYEDECG